jgi:alpha-galactosidase
VHHSTVLTEYALDPELPGGDWSSVLIPLERVD